MLNLPHIAIWLQIVEHHRSKTRGTRRRE